MAHDFILEEDTSWDGLGIEGGRLDPGLRLIASLLDVGDLAQLFRRTGIRANAGGRLERPRLPLFLELAPGEGKRVLADLFTATLASDGFQLKFPLAYFDVVERNPHMALVSARLQWEDNAITPMAGGAARGDAFRQAVARLTRRKGIDRITLPNALQPCLEDSLHDIALPKDREVNGHRLDGEGIVVGIIDDGCAVAHRHFLDPDTARTRIRYLWDQARTPKQGGAGWVAAAGFPGMEIDGNALDGVLAACTRPNGLIDEDAVHEALRYDIGIATHGTHVMDIAAGNGSTLAGWEGVARKADIVFVQLPAGLVEEGGPLLEDHIHDGVTYIFERAAKLGAARGLPGPVPAVVNISYGGYTGSHDGHSPLAAGLDAALKGTVDRAIVVSAGNGFEADCHAHCALAGGQRRELTWMVGPADPTSNQVDLWYPAGASLELTLTAPGAAAPIGAPLPVGKWMVIRRSDGNVVGWVYHVQTPNGLMPKLMRVQLNATAGEDASAVSAAGLAAVTGQAPPGAPPMSAPAPSGAWLLGLRNVGAASAEVHAWIARDDMRRTGGKRRQQSRFAPADADPRSTVADLATGRLTLCVGAHNTATNETCAYSAMGPTRDGRPKPEVTAPAEETATHRGVLCASSRRAQPSAFNGTSAAAPHAAGLVALLMQYNRLAGGTPLTAQQINARIVKGATSAHSLPPPPARKLWPNHRQDVDPNRPPGKRQADHFKAVIGAGKINVPKTM